MSKKLNTKLVVTLIVVVIALSQLACVDQMFAFRKSTNPLQTFVVCQQGKSFDDGMKCLK